MPRGPGYRERKKRKIFMNIGMDRCLVCGEKDWICLDFHHIEPSKKSFNVGVYLKQKSYKTLYKEIQKCVVLCANCHRQFERDQRKNELLAKLDLYIKIQTGGHISDPPSFLRPI